MEKTKENASEVADILGTLAELDRGNFTVNAGRLLLELNKAVVDVRKAGSMTIKLKIAPAGFAENGRVNQFEIQPEISIDKPEHPLRKSLFFVTEDNRMTRDDPDQADLFEDRKEPVNNGRN